MAYSSLPGLPGRPPPCPSPASQRPVCFGACKYRPEQADSAVPPHPATGRTGTGPTPAPVSSRLRLHLHLPPTRRRARERRPSQPAPLPPARNQILSSWQWQHSRAPSPLPPPFTPRLSHSLATSSPPASPPPRAPLLPTADARVPAPAAASSPPSPAAMAGDDNPFIGGVVSPVDACPLCGGSGAGPPSRVALAKRAPPADASLAASVTASGGDEASALREQLARQRRGVADLQAELEAERGAAAGAASEAMSMILRLQRDKSEAMMEARQYRRYAEERFAHDAAEVGALHDALDRRDAAVRALAARLRACQARLLSLGFPASPSPASPTAAADRPCPCSDDSDSGEEYRSVRCLDHPADVGTPRTHHLLNRIPSPDDSDKAVVMFGSPRRRHARTFSSGGGVPYDCRIALADEFPLFTADRDAPDQDADDEEADRVYTVDAVHGVPVMAPEDCCYFGDGDVAARARAGAGGRAEEDEIQKLKARLLALEADRESMRHAILSMGDEKVQVVLLREIAQQLCRDAAPFPADPLKAQPRPQPVVMAQRKVVKRQSSFAKVFILTVIKWVVSIFCWRRKSNRIRYPIGMCGSNVGLMLVLDRFPKQRQKKIPKRKLSASTL